MKLKVIVLIMAVLGLTNVYANVVYIDQVGDSSVVTIMQDGTGNIIGDSVNPAFIGGGSNVLDVQQIGSGNELSMVVNGATASVIVETVGSNNTQDIQCGTVSSSGCSGSTITQTVTGDNNTITQDLGSGANHTSNITVAGDTNNITHTSTSSGTTTLNAVISGNLNTVGVTQSGMTTQNVTLNSTGNSNTITINQSN
jgi:hypothetical protein